MFFPIVFRLCIIFDDTVGIIVAIEFFGLREGISFAQGFRERFGGHFGSHLELVKIPRGEILGGKFIFEGFPKRIFRKSPHLSNISIFLGSGSEEFYKSVEFLRNIGEVVIWHTVTLRRKKEKKAYIYND